MNTRYTQKLVAVLACVAWFAACSDGATSTPAAKVDAVADAPVADTAAPDTAPPADGVDAAVADTTDPVDTAGEDADAAGPADAADSADATPEPPLPPSVCDAGDEAWAIRAIQVLLGRKPWSMAEVDVLVQFVKVAGREKVAQGLLQTPEAQQRWVEVLYQLSHITRSGDTVNPNCYGTFTAATETTALAEHIRDQGPDTPMPKPGATMGDLAHSAVALDDVSPWFDAQLFAMLGRPGSFCQNVDAVEMDRLRRMANGERFMALYMNRSLGCMNCHNSNYSTTWTDDPATNRFYAIPGSFEKTLLGVDQGPTEVVAYQALRARGVLSKNAIVEAPEIPVWPDDKTASVRPWQWAPACGQFLAKGDVLPALDGTEGFLGGPLGAKGSIWDVEARLRAGLNKFKGATKPLDTVAIAADPDTALAYLLGNRLASDLWALVYGSPLTLAHRFPRNSHERDVMADLTQTLITHHWSLRAVATALVLEPTFNELPASAGCGPAGPYSLVPIFDPFTTNIDDPTQKANGPADGLHREQPLTLVRMAAKAAGWVPPEPMPIIDGEIALDDSIGFPQPKNLNEVAFRIGGFLDDARPGTEDMDPSGFALWRSLVASCRVELPDGTKLSTPATADGDYVDQMITKVVQQQGTVGDIVTALRDRLITEPDLPAGELQVTLALFGAGGLGTPAIMVTNNLEKATRAYCGALLASPQFWLTGVPGAKQKARAKLAVQPTATFLYNCQMLAPSVFKSTDYDVACTATGVTVTAKGTP